MHIDARTIDDHSEIEGDICIVGAGAAGISIALQFAGTSTRVVLLEGGGFSYEDAIQDLFHGKTTGQPYYPLKSSRLHFFGGTTGHWGGLCSPMDEIDFTDREWIENSGWPIRRSDLLPYYRLAQPILELDAFEYGLNYWQQQDPNLRLLPFDEAVVYSKMWQFSPPTRFGKKYRDVIVNSRNITLYTYANAVDIRVTESLKAVDRITVRNLAGKTHEVKARFFILACNGIQNPRLLLASRSQIPAGIGNEHDLVGRYFMEHLEVKSAELWLNEDKRLPLYEGNGKIRAELAISAEAQARYRILNGTAALSPLGLSSLEESSNIESWNDDDPRASLDKMHKMHEEANRKKWIKRLTTRYWTSYQLFTRMELLPNPENRVQLDSETDSLGVPRAKLHWKLSPFEKQSIRKIYEIIGQQAGRAGIGRVRLMEYLRDSQDDTWPSFTGGGWHHMGCTRMHEDPRKGVVDKNCKVFNVDNLFVAGDSCFTTGGAVNPTLTIIALSLRLSDHVKGLL